MIDIHAVNRIILYSLWNTVNNYLTLNFEVCRNLN